MPIAASSNAEPPKTVISSMLNRSRDVDSVTISSIVRTSDTGRPVTCRSCSWIGPISACGSPRVRMIQAIGDDADDLPRLLGRELPHHALADDEPVVHWIGALFPEAPRHRLVDDDHRRRRSIVADGKRA